MADNKTNTPNPNGIAIFNALKDASTPLSFAEIADIAGIEAKTGYLTAARKIARENGFELTKVENAITAKVTTITEYPNGLRIEKSKDIAVDGYTLAPKAE